MEINKIMKKQKHKVYHYISLAENKRAKSAYLMGAYLVICKILSAEDALAYFKDIKPEFKQFLDAISVHVHMNVLF
jgi:hypothetical protein